MRLIDADALLKALNDYGLSYRADINGMIMQATTIEPSGDLISRADAIEAVRLESAKRESLGRGDILNILSALPSAEQVISKLNNPCDSLLTDESNGSKEHKSKLDLISRADAINTLETEKRCTDREEDVSGLTLAKLLISALPSADAEHDGCDGCRYEHNTEYEYPCSECKQNYVDMWEQKPNDFIEVVRCKDCEHWDTAAGECYGLDGVHYSKADDFCSHGERKEP